MTVGVRPDNLHGMQCVVHTDLTSDVARVLAWLGRDPVGHGLQLGLLHAIVDGTVSTDQPPLLAHVETAGALIGVGLQTDSYRRLVLSEMPAAAAGEMARVLHGSGYQPPGVVGPVSAARAFAATWTRVAGQRSGVSMAQRLHRLDKVLPPVGVPGRLRNAETTELDLMCAWATAMADDIGLDSSGRDRQLAAQLRRRIDENRMAVWEVDDEPVSIAGPSRPAAGVVRIGLVYTPLGHRRNGYAAACVAAVSQRALEGGAIACSLYTDLSNPTSNGVYRRIGYYPVSDAEELTFIDS